MAAGTVALLGALGGIVSPAPAQPATGAGTLTPLSTQTYLTAAGNHVKAKNNGPIRECFRQECKEVASLAPGSDLAWDKFANNQVGHRWYHITSYTTHQAGHPEKRWPVSGWIFCGNTTGAC